MLLESDELLEDPPNLCFCAPALLPKSMRFRLREPDEGEEARDQQRGEDLYSRAKSHASVIMWRRRKRLETCGSPARARGARPPALIPLISICLSELRGDFERLVSSHWAEAPRRQAAILLSTLKETCDRQGLDALSALFRSMTGLMDLSREEARLVGSAMGARLEELLRAAERLLAQDPGRRIA